MTVYAIISEWYVGCESGMFILGIFTDKEKAKKELKNYVDSTARIDANYNNLPIKTDTDTSFEAYLDETRIRNHISVFISEEELE